MGSIANTAYNPSSWGGALGDVTGSLFGGLANTNKFKANGNDIPIPFGQDQLNTSYQQTQTGLQQQQDFLNALQAQNGVQNQTNVFNQQQGLANQLQDASNGGGPNPAMAQLANTTGQNVASQAALMASQRGAGANVGLLARQAALQGGNLQQQAVGQGAALSAQQQIAARQQLQQQQSMLGQTAGQQVGQQANATQFYNQAAQSEQQNQLNANNQAIQNQVNSTNSQNQINSGVAGQNSKQLYNMQGGAIAGIAAALAHGGEVKNMYSGGPTSYGLGADTNLTGQQEPAPFGLTSQSLTGSAPVETGYGLGANTAVAQPSSTLGKLLFDSAPSNTEAEKTPGEAYAESQDGKKDAGFEGMKEAGGLFGGMLGGGGGEAAMAKGGMVPAKLSPGEVYLPPKKVNEVAKGKASALDGKKVPGKAKYKGDTVKNDTVPANLQEGGFVIPKSIMESKDPAKEAHAFVMAHLAKKGLR